MFVTPAVSACAGVSQPPADSGAWSNSQPARNGARPRARSVEIGHGGGIDVELGVGAVWVSTRDGVLRVDPSTDLVTDEISLEGAFDLDLGGDSLWVTNTYEGTLSRIDVPAGRVTEPVDPGLVTPYRVDATSNAVWVTGSGDDGGT